MFANIYQRCLYKITFDFNTQRKDAFSIVYKASVNLNSIIRICFTYILKQDIIETVRVHSFTTEKNVNTVLFHLAPSFSLKQFCIFKRYPLIFWDYYNMKI